MLQLAHLDGSNYLEQVWAVWSVFYSVVSLFSPYSGLRRGLAVFCDVAVHFGTSWLLHKVKHFNLASSKFDCN